MDMPVRSQEEALSNAAFDALLNAMARPGSVRMLPGAGFEPVIAALIDRECVVSVSDPLVMAALMRTGARLGETREADHVFCGAADAAEHARHARIGSDYYPDDGATLVVAAAIGTGPGLRLTGPGIETVTEIAIGGIDAEFWSERARRIRYPMGFDVVVIDGSNVVAIPRSTIVETV